MEVIPVNEVTELVKAREKILLEARRRTAARKTPKFVSRDGYTVKDVIEMLCAGLCNHCEQSYNEKEGWDCSTYTPCEDYLRLVGRLAHFEEMGE